MNISIYDTNKSGRRGRSDLCSFLCPPSRLENLFNVVFTVLVRRLEIVQLLVEVGDIRLQFGGLGGEALLYIGHWAKDEPMRRRIRGTVDSKTYESILTSSLFLHRRWCLWGATSLR